MPHVVVKMYSGRSAEQKGRLADAVTAAVTESLGCSRDAVSVAIEDVEPQDWARLVHEPDIAGRPETLFKPPGPAKS